MRQITARALSFPCLSVLALLITACFPEGKGVGNPAETAQAGAITEASADSALPTAPRQVPSRSLTFRLSGEPETLDWNVAHTSIDTYVLMNLMEGLLSFDENFKIVPSLAKSWTISSDGKVYTFKLKPGLKWSDGAALTARDFEYSWKRLLSPVTAASYAYFLFDIKGAKEFNEGKIKDFSRVGIKAVDELTFRVELNRPVAHWIYIPTFWVTFPLRQDIVERHGSAWPKPGRMVTCGPFTLAAYDLNSKIVMRANPNYHGEKGNVEEVVALIVQDDSTAMNLYESGKLDFLGDIATLDLQRLEQHPDLKTFPYLKTGYMGFVVSQYPASNPGVRRAISMAIDRSKIGAILNGGQTAATTFVPPPLLAHDGQIGLKYDPVAAKKELRASGWDSTRTMKLDLVTPNWDKALTLAQFIQGELKKNLGIELAIQPFDHKMFRAQVDLKAFPLFLLSWGADYPDPDNFLTLFTSTAGNNRTAWKNARYDELIQRAGAGLNEEARLKDYSEAQKLLLEKDAVVLPLYYEPNKALVRSRVKGLRLNPLNYMYLRNVSVE